MFSGRALSLSPAVAFATYSPGMPLFSRKRKKKKEKKEKKPKKGAKKAEEAEEDEPPTQEELMGDQSWAKTEQDDFSNEVESLFAEMKSTLGPAGPDIKIGALGGDGQAGVDDLEPEPEVEPEPAPRPVRKKLTKEEKMAKMKEMGKKREAAAAAASEGDGAAAPQDDAELAIMARCEELFEKYDEDNSGSIDSAEFSALCFDMGLAFEDEADKELVLSMLDTDGDGSVSLDEFKVWWLANKDTFFVQNYSDNVKAAIHFFKKFDTDLSVRRPPSPTCAVFLCPAVPWREGDDAPWTGGA